MRLAIVFSYAIIICASVFIGLVAGKHDARLRVLSGPIKTSQGTAVQVILKQDIKNVAQAGDTVYIFKFNP